MVKQPAGAYALLTDGSSVQIRQARPDDAYAVRAMHAAMSEDNMYLRFFSLSPGNADREAERVCRGAEPSHVALLACRGSEVVGVATYEMNDNAPTAEVALAVADRFHRHGIATLLLEHLVSIARQRHVRAFTATTLAENFAMLRIFADAGLPAHKESYAGAVDVTIPLPTSDGDTTLADYLEAVQRRESRADVASLKHLFMPESVAVVGASRRPDSVGARLLSNIVSGRFHGRVIPVNPNATSLAGLPCVASVDDLPDGVDLAIVVVPAAAVAEVAEQCGRRGVRSLVVITSGLADARPALLETCRRHGMRLVGPNCFGIAVPRHRSGRDLRAQPLECGHRRRSRPVWRHRRLPDRAPFTAGHRRLFLHLYRRQVRRIKQRPPRLVGAGSADQAGHLVPRIVRQPAQVR